MSSGQLYIENSHFPQVQQQSYVSKFYHGKDFINSLKQDTEDIIIHRNSELPNLL